MMKPSDTPPNGDFARYVERLTSSNADAAAIRDGQRWNPGSPPPMPGKATSAAANIPAAPVSSSSRTTVTRQVTATSGASGVKAATGVSLFSHIRWLIVIWVLSQALGRFVPGGSFLFVVALVFYAAWLVFKVKSGLTAGVVARIRQAVDEEARKRGKSPRP